MADPNQLNGRALDEACAKAMGWKPPTMMHLTKDGSPTWLLAKDASIPAYSTDAACIPKMTAWLEARAYNLEFCWNDRAKLYRARGDHVVEGATLQEALARLVVAVGEASRG